MASGKSNEDFRRRRLSLVDQDPATLAKAAAAMQVSPAGTSKPKARRLSVSPEMGQKSVVPVSFNPELCGTYSCHGIEPMGATGAKAKINQDRGCVVTPFAEPEDGSYVQALFCVYDGHGASGDKASEFTMRKVADLVEQKLTAGIKEPEALRTAFLETDALLKADRTIDAELSGTTAVAAYPPERSPFRDMIDGSPVSMRIRDETPVRIQVRMMLFGSHSSYRRGQR